MRDLAGKIGISQAMLFAYRSGKSEPTLKVLRKLEAAERAAGIGGDVPAAADSPAESETNPKESGPVADQFPDAGKMMDLLRDEIAEKNRQIERLLGLLAAALDSRAPEPPPAAGQRPGQVSDPERAARVKG